MSTIFIDLMRRYAFALLLALVPLVLKAAPGDLDRSFSGDGIVNQPTNNGIGDSDFDVALQTDGKILVAGQYDFDMAVWRYNADGSADITFNGTGKVVTKIEGESSLNHSLAVQADGKIVVAGTLLTFPSSFALVRYNANGSLDNSFNGSGKVTTSFGDNSAGAKSVAVQSDGKIILAGHTFVPGTTSVGRRGIFAVARYNADGSLDTSFNGSGMVTTSFGRGDSWGESVAVQADGRILVAGYYVANIGLDGEPVRFAVARYNTDGSLDKSFNRMGKLLTGFGGSHVFAKSVAVQADGRILVAGFSLGDKDDFAVVRYKPNGSLDTSFNGSGKVTTEIGSNSGRGYKVVVQADGRILVGGISFGQIADIGFLGEPTTHDSTEFAVVRYNANGSLDTTLNGIGKVTTAISSHDDARIGLALQPDGKAVMAGSSFYSGFTLVRYETGEVVDVVSEVVAAKGGAVPGAGVEGSGIPAGAVWTNFGAPAINDAGTVAFLGSWKAGALKEKGIFSNGLVAKVRSVVPNDGIGTMPIGAVFSAIKDPLLAEDGAVAMLTTLENGKGLRGITSANDQAIYLDADGVGAGAAKLVAHKGSEATGVSGSRWNAFTSVAFGKRSLAFTGTMTVGSGGVESTDDTGLWIYKRSADMLALALREGSELLGSTIKTISVLAARPGSPGQGRGSESTSGQIAVRVTLADERQIVGTVDENGSVSLDYAKGDYSTAYHSTEPPEWLSFGLPTQNTSGALAFVGKVEDWSTSNVVEENDTALFAEDDTTFTLARVVAEGDPAPFARNAAFIEFKDPVSGPNRSIAFIGTLNRKPLSIFIVRSATDYDDFFFSGTPNNSGIWWRDTTGTLRAVAIKGGEAAEAAGPAPFTKWKAFTSLALPEGTRGPIFQATLTGGVTAANDTGLWAVDSNRVPRLLVRKGDKIGARTVQSFSAIGAVAGSPAQTRSFNNNGEVIVRVTDTAGVQSLVKFTIP